MSDSLSRLRAILGLAPFVLPGCFLQDECQGQDECNDRVQIDVFTAPALQVQDYTLRVGIEATTITCTMDTDFDSLTQSYEFGCDDNVTSASADGPNLIGRFRVFLTSAPTSLTLDLEVGTDLVLHGEGSPTYEMVEACNGQCSEGTLRIDGP